MNNYKDDGKMTLHNCMMTLLDGMTFLQGQINSIPKTFKYSTFVRDKLDPITHIIYCTSGIYHFLCQTFLKSDSTQYKI